MVCTQGYWFQRMDQASVVLRGNKCNCALRLQIDEPYIDVYKQFPFRFFQIPFVCFVLILFLFFAFFYFNVVAIVRSIEMHEYLRVRGILLDP